MKTGGWGGCLDLREKEEIQEPLAHHIACGVGLTFVIIWWTNYVTYEYAYWKVQEVALHQRTREHGEGPCQRTNRICCHNTDLVRVNGHDRIILVIFCQALYGFLVMDPVWSETCWSTFKYFIILIVSTYYILFISWIVKCLIIIDARCTREDSKFIFRLELKVYAVDFLQFVEYLSDLVVP